MEAFDTSAHFLTVGHSNHAVHTFLELLSGNGVSAVADVRSAPYSRFAPHFSKAPLERTLSGIGIGYVFLGDELGGRSSDPSCYERGRIVYDRVAETNQFTIGIDRLIRGSRSERIAILCTEKDPLDCHRTLLVSRALVAKGARVDHILADGAVESHEDSMARLLAAQPPADLFSTDEERFARALRDQEARIAYVDQELVRASGVSFE